jgi:hypothetical protein
LVSSGELLFETLDLLTKTIIRPGVMEVELAELACDIDFRGRSFIWENDSPAKVEVTRIIPFGS